MALAWPKICFEMSDKAHEAGIFSASQSFSVPGQWEEADDGVTRHGPV